MSQSTPFAILFFFFLQDSCIFPFIPDISPICPHTPSPKRNRTALSSQFLCLNFHCLSDEQRSLTNPHNCAINISRYKWVVTLSWGWRISRTLLLSLSLLLLLLLLLLLFKTCGQI